MVWALVLSEPGDFVSLESLINQQKLSHSKARSKILELLMYSMYVWIYSICILKPLI